MRQSAKNVRRQKMPAIFFYGPELEKEKKRELIKSFTESASKATGIDKRIAGNQSRLGKDGRELFEAGYSPEDISEHFCRGGTWYKQHWKGKKGQKPTTKDIRENIQEFRNRHSNRRYLEGAYSEHINQ